MSLLSQDLLPTQYKGGVFAQRAHSASYYGVPYLNIGTSAG